MLLITNHRRSLIASRRTAWVFVAAVLCFASMAKPAHAEFLIRDFSESVSALVLPVDDFLGWTNVGSNSSAGGCDMSAPNNQVFPAPPAEPSPVDAFLGLDLTTRECCSGNGSGSGSTSSTSSGGGAGSAAVNCGVIELKCCVLVSWLQLERFLFLPPAPCSGLLRPPQTFS